MSDTASPEPSSAGDRIAHFRLLEVIGRGGMGIVWRAQDLVLGRDVAIKLLPPDAARDEKRRRRFLEEAKLASSIKDSRIVQVFELGRHDDLDYIVMELVDGAPLSSRLRGRPLPGSFVTSLGAQVAQALASAHACGVIHRDLKPANILVTDRDEVKIVDFGLARLMEQSLITWDTRTPTSPLGDEGSAERPDAAQTARSTIVGTLPYMSPEQIRGQETDARGDIFSLGAVLYEMASGRRPFRGATPHELMQEVLSARPEPLRALVPEIHPEMDRVVMKALASRPADRYQTMEQLSADLRAAGGLVSGTQAAHAAARPSRPTWQSPRPLIAGVIVVVLATIITMTALPLGRNRLASLMGFPRGGAADAHTILIIPIATHGDVEEAAFLGRAAAESIAIRLAQASNLKVLPVTPLGQDLSSADPLGAASRAAALGAGRLVTGSITRDRGAAHASLTLVDTAAGRIVWGTTYDSAQSELSGIVLALSDELSGQLDATFRKTYDFGRTTVPANPEVRSSPEFVAMLSAAYGADTLDGFLQTSQALVARFPDDFDAWGWRAGALAGLYQQQPAPQHRAELEAALDTMNRIDPANPYGDFTHAWLMMVDTSGDVEKGIAMLSRLLTRTDLSSNLRSETIVRRANGYRSRGPSGVDLAIADLTELIALAPSKAYNYYHLSGALADAGRLDEAVQRARQATALEPGGWIYHEKLCGLLETEKKPEEAVAACQKAAQLQEDSGPWAHLALVLAQSHRMTDASRAAAHAEQLPFSLLGDWYLGVYWALRGDRVRSVQHLRRYSENTILTVEEITQERGFGDVLGTVEFRSLIADLKQRAAAHEGS